MDQLKQSKYAVEKNIVEKALKEFENGKINEDELKQIADFTVTGMKQAGSRQALLDFLNALSGRWPVFESLALIEEGDNREEVEDEVYSGVLALAQHGKIDNAIKLAKTMTN